ncbi:fumarate hydratase (fumarase C),aerobic Class II [Desulfamplus magnetovallimortis]|uniref:Fumarate hydratase class II n=1 Tax=Desulfamplus magnetovallimortis TaxID=1246637 RepID=A0A1W1H6I5_9BACT|nr:class II fumarate hydratase [Desulfamplus magnetovallimortis]SLM28083.1 fumarate hydratase (fumarase C),aerobic Class II [Desulfamplus magnetovallimortis]
MEFRIEKDSMGEVKVPSGAYYGAQTCRAVENFPISGIRFPTVFINALALVKRCAAVVNLKLDKISPEISRAIVTASDEVMSGKYDDQFLVDIFQTGSGTSTNMNMNEVLSSRANEILTGRKGGKSPVHPNDHVNAGQSSNDVIPTAIHISALIAMEEKLIPALGKLEQELTKKSHQFRNIKKIGRTHLQDAVPMTLGDEFSGYARQIHLGVKRLKGVESNLSELALGGTAVGSGLNAHPEFAVSVIELISQHTNLYFREAENHFEAQAAQDAAVEASSMLKCVAVSLVKIANDIRWLSSGPRCGLGEISIPSLQPGSSIMPGKVNPVIPEVVLQVAAQVIANDTAVTLGGQGGNFELNVMLPLIAHNLLQSIDLLASASEVFAEKCISGITANEEKCRSFIEQSLALVTGLIPHIGYDRAAEIAYKAWNSGQTIREVAEQEKILSLDILNELL